MILKLEHPRLKTPTDRQFPRYHPGMTTVEYIRMYQWINRIKTPTFHFIKENS
jgi:hypothetical protein